MRIESASRGACVRPRGEDPGEVPARKCYAIQSRALEPVTGKANRPRSWRIGFIGLSFKSGTDDLRESPLVTLAEQLIGNRMQIAVYDSAVRLWQLLGANRRYIDAHRPHIGKLLRAEIGGADQ